MSSGLSGGGWPARLGIGGKKGSGLTSGVTERSSVAGTTAAAPVEGVDERRVAELRLLL